MQVDFTKEKLIYPKGITIHDKTTSNFTHPENFVVFECVHRLLETGYKAESLELEPKWQLGREAKSGKADILVRDNENNPYLIIECKTTDSKISSEFAKEWERMQEYGGQLFSYLQQEKGTKFLCLYTSDFKDTLEYTSYIIQAFDNEEYLQENDLEKSYKKANNNNELFAVWKESYKSQYFTQGIFESNVNAYKILELTPTFDNLKELKEEGKYHEFAKILRKHNISGKENAFDKLVNIFLCKIYDESFNKNNLKFGYFGVMADTYANMQDRLMTLYKEAMGEFLREKITFVSNDDIEKAFKKLHAKDLKAQIQRHIKELKFYSNNDFAFLEVHNEELFLQNALVLKEIIELFAPYKLTQNSTNQFLGNLFELFLQKGMKQDEGQFFTPIQICEFIMYSLPLDSMTKAFKPLKVLDFACGAGHFLNTYANELKRYATQDLQEHYKQIYGIEKEYRLSKVAKVSSAMYGQNEINILYADALAAHELENPKTDKGNKQKPQINNHSFDLLIANPPYSVKGFLETLSDKSKKTYTLFTDEINIETNNAIECFFIERANQLLKDNAKAAIILPSSILNKDGLYKSTREILLSNFDFIAIVELGSGTFGATGTNTIILFLRKKEHFTPENASISQDYSNIKNYIESGHLSQNEPYKDYVKAFNAYCDFRGFDKKDYESFLNGSLESQPSGWAAGFRTQKDLESSYNLGEVPSETTKLLELDSFKEYHSAFKETSDYKKLVESKAYKDSKDKDALRHKAFLAYAQKIEKDKLLYFCLSFNQEVLIIKAPSDTKEQKKFLGYEWSNRKGDEGLKELHKPYSSPLFERDNPQNKTKLAYLIRQAFLESSNTPSDPTPSLRESETTEAIHTQEFQDNGLPRSLTTSRNDKITIPKDLSPYAFKARLIDMLDFSKVDFNKAISLNPVNLQGEGNPQNPFANSKFELVRLGEVCDLFNGYAFKKTDYVEKSNTLLIRMGNIRPNGQFDPEHKIAYLPDNFAEKYRNYLLNENDVIIAMTDMGSAMNILGVPTLVKNLKGRNFLLNQRVGKLFNFKDNVNISYLKYILASKEIKQIFENFGYGGLQINLGKAQILSIKIPLPPLEIQKQIVEECEKVEEQYNTIRMSIEKYQELIKAILIKCGIVDSSEGGGISRLIDSLLQAIQELESKLDPTPSLRGKAEAIHMQEFQDNGLPRSLTTSRNDDLKTLLDSLPTPPPQGWDRVRLGEICEILIGGTPTRNNSAYFQGDNLWVSIAEMNGQVITDTKEKISDEAIKKSNVKLIPKGTTLLSFKLSIGKAAIAGKDLYTNEAIAGLIPNDNNKLLDMFLFYIFKWQTIDLDLKGNNAFGKSLNSSILKQEVKIPLPPLEAQEKIIEFIESIESKITSIDSMLEILEKRKAEILNNALNASNERDENNLKR